MSIRVAQLGASFKPTPPKLSPPQLDLSSPPPAQLVIDPQDPNARGRSPVIELILESPVIQHSLNKSLNKQRSRATCYIVDAEPGSPPDSAVSDTEETPNEVILQANLKRNKSQKPQRRIGPIVAVEAGSEASVKPLPVQVPRIQWNGNIHVRHGSTCRALCING